MKKTIITSAIVALAVALLVGLVGGNDQSNPELGGTRFPNGISADSTSPSAGEVRGTTLTVTGAQTLSGAMTLGGDLTVTTSNTATSTATVGCIQTYATSTATPVMLVPTQYGTTTSAFDGSTAGLAVAAVYGSCPI